MLCATKQTNTTFFYCYKFWWLILILFVYFKIEFPNVWTIYASIVMLAVSLLMACVDRIGPSRMMTHYFYSQRFNVNFIRLACDIPNKRWRWPKLIVMRIEDKWAFWGGRYSGQSDLLFRTRQKYFRCESNDDLSTMCYWRN